jgi:peptidoglycan/xylan/chitin deacetylase (PgdA/CDA1 family)
MNAGVTVLVYHAIGECPPAEDRNNLFVTPSAFRQQVRFLIRRRRVVPLDAALGPPLPAGPSAVALTFDDAYRNVLENAIPILEGHGLPSTIFVPTAWIGERAGWLSPSACDSSIMTRDELREAARRGADLQSHGHRHLDFARVGLDEIRDDLRTSAKILTGLTGAPPRYLAYPFGARTTAAEREVEASGISSAFSIDVPGNRRFALERVQITPLDGPRLFALKTSGRYLRWRHAPGTRAAYAAVRPFVRPLLERR